MDSVKNLTPTSSSSSSSARYWIKRCGHDMRKLAAAGLMSLSLLLPLGVSAQFSVSDSGLSQTGGAAKLNTDMDLADFIGSRIIQPVLGLLGLTFLCLMVYAGGLWMTAAGNDKRVAKAKEIMTGAVIGAVIVVAAYALTSAIFTALSTGDISGNPEAAPVATE